MNSDSIVLVAGETRERGAIQRVLATTGARIDVKSEDRLLREGLGSSRLAVVFYDAAKSPPNAALAWLSNQTSCPVTVVVPGSQRPDLQTLFSYAAVTNIVPETGDFISNELVVTAQKILRNDIFGLDKYLTWGMPRHDYLVRSTTEQHAAMGELLRYLQALGVNNRLASLATGVADELMMNAIYSAPVDAQGRPKYADLPRNQEVDLAPEESVGFSFTCDGRYLGLCVNDGFGRLEAKTVREYLRKCLVAGDDQIDTKLRGGGLGLYSVFQSLNHLIFNVAPGHRTEVIGLLEISGTFRDHVRQPKSFNIFVGNGASR